MSKCAAAGLQLLVTVIAYVSGLTVTDQPIKICPPNEIEWGASCLDSESSLVNQSYVISKAYNTGGDVKRPFSFNTDAEITTAQISNKLDFVCDTSEDPVGEILNDIIPELSKVFDYNQAFPTSCLDVLNKNASAVSGDYRILLQNGSLVTVYCDMVGTDCEELGGWTRIGYFNMAEGKWANCPSPLIAKKYDGISYSLCKREAFGPGCDSVFFDSLEIQYNTVCGRALGYQWGSPDGVQWSWYGIDDNYVDGLSITYDNPRKHIWTYVAGVQETGTGGSDCPCNHGSWFSPPSFLGDHYTCESGTDAWTLDFFPDDKLWDGEQCNDFAEDGCCPTGNKHPWFSRLLDDDTTSDIEVRLCDDENEDNERVPIEMVEIYIR